MSKINEMRELVDTLNKASNSYYNENVSIMENREYNLLFDELKDLEEYTGVILSNSPTQRAGYKIVGSNLPKIKHDIPLLSLGKIKDSKELVEWLGDKEGVLMLKMDGGTGKAEYKSKLINELSTRGGSDTNEGENISHNINSIGNIPQSISIENETQIVGEMYMDFEDFNRINNKITDTSKKYTHPRNLATATSSILDSRICKERNIKFKAFNIIKGMDFKTKVQQFEWLNSQGFDVVDYWIVNKDNLEEKIQEIEDNLPNLAYPVDGLVLSYNNLEYGLSLGRTSHHFKHSVSFKFEDSWYSTVYDHTEWNTSRLGQIVPTGVFKTVLIENAKISRATLSNISIFESLKLGKGDTIEVSKRNLIIPKIENNITRSNTEKLINKCPTCGGEVEIRQDKKSKIMYCLNINCEARLSKIIENYCSKKAMNIEGVSSSTINLFMENNVIDNICDLYTLENKRGIILNLPKFGIAKYNNLIQSINKSKKCTLDHFIISLGIPQISTGGGRVIANYFKTIEALTNAIESRFDFSQLPDIGDITNEAIHLYFSNEDNLKLFNDLSNILEFEKEEVKNMSEIKENPFLGKRVYPTGKFALKKDELKVKLEELGAIISGGYAKSLDMLIAGGDISKSGKVDKANADGVKVVSEEFLMQYIK